MGLGTQVVLTLLIMAGVVVLIIKYRVGRRNLQQSMEIISTGTPGE